MTEQSPPEQPTAPPKAWFWPAFVIALLAGQIVMILAMVYVATSDRSFAVEPDYYQKGLHWDDIAAQRQRNEQLGWRLAIELGEPAAPGGARPFRCTVTDRQGRPLDNALVDLVAFPHARGNDREFLTLQPAGEGLYRAEVVFARDGLWEFRFVVRRGADTFTFTEQRRV